MPGFLGTEKLFNERFGKPILASRDSKSSSKEQEAGMSWKNNIEKCTHSSLYFPIWKGALALEALHKQVLPFLLRRLKEDVLHDLPPKIIQDYYSDLSDLQVMLKYFALLLQEFGIYITCLETIIRRVCEISS